jgi:hypothetical protein
MCTLILVGLIAHHSLIRRARPALIQYRRTQR